jgi:hypothetical protein
MFFYSRQQPAPVALQPQKQQMPYSQSNAITKKKVELQLQVAQAD